MTGNLKKRLSKPKKTTEVISVLTKKETEYIMEALHRDSSPTGLLSVYHMTFGHTTKIYWQLTNANDQ